MTARRTISPTSKREPSHIQANPKVALGFTGEGGIFSDAIYVAVEGDAELIRDKAIFKAHWTSDLDRWFDKGVDTPNIVLIKVVANRITYWDGERRAKFGFRGLSDVGKPLPTLSNG
jgi:general stress protein 26